MNDFIFDLLVDENRCCNLCSHFDRGVKQADVYYIKNANPDINEYKLGHKFCMKTKKFVFFYECCTEFTKRIV
jgi:hypothetical protein